MVRRRVLFLGAKPTWSSSLVASRARQDKVSSLSPLFSLSFLSSLFVCRLVSVFCFSLGRPEELVRSRKTRLHSRAARLHRCAGHELGAQWARKTKRSGKKCNLFECGTFRIERQGTKNNRQGEVDTGWVEPKGEPELWYQHVARETIGLFFSFSPFSCHLPLSCRGSLLDSFMS